MSPEQSAAERTIDARSDQYSLACVLYEMLVGEPPFTGPTNQVVMQRRATEDARAMTVSRKGVPDNVERATATALSRLPADRFGTMADFSAALEIPVESPPRLPASRARRLTTVVAAMAVVGVLAFAGARALTRTVEAADAPMRLAVLPFQLIGDSADAYIADGMADEVSVKLTNVPGFELIARNSASQYRTPQKPLDEVAQELGVRFLLTGKLTWTRRGSEQLIIVRPQLVEVTQGAVVVRWSETFDGSFTDVFQVQSEIASRIAEKLKVAVTPEARAQLAEAPTTNHAAYGEFLRGEKAYLGSSGPTAQAEAVAHYENALALDSTFARAWARLSQVSSSIYARSSDATAKATALSAAQRAIALDPKLQDGYLAMGNQFTLVHNDYAHAIEAYRAGLAINASHAELQGALGLALQGLGRYDEAIASMRRGLELDPRSLLFNRRLTRALTWAHRFDEAEEASRASLRLGPTDPSAIQYAVLLKLAKGDLEGARAITRAFPPGVDLPELLTYWATNFPISGWFLDHDQQDLIQRLPPRAYRQEINRWYVLAVFAFRRGDTASARLFADSIGRANGYRVLNPADPNARLDYAFWASLTGRRAEAIREAEAAVATRADDQYVGQQMRHNLIQVCIQAGDYERALDHLEKLVKLPYYVTPAWLRIDPSFDLIRNHPRFQAIINGRYAPTRIAPGCTRSRNVVPPSWWSSPSASSSGGCSK
jgi:serine/threonine-protein kinase